jgi:hypothetical protein
VHSTGACKKLIQLCVYVRQRSTVVLNCQQVVMCT